MRINGFLAVSFILVVQQTTAQHSEYNGDTSITSLHEVVLTAQRSKQENIRVPYSVSAVPGTTLQDFSPRSTPEALMGLPGVFVQKTNHGGGSPFVRGLTGNQTLILVDGIRMNNSIFRYGPNQYLNTIDAYTIGRIEIAKGTGSVQYGTDAMGGVVQVFTKEPAFNPEKSVVQGKLIGKYMTGGMERTGRGEIQYAGKRFSMLAGISRKNFGDFIGGDTTGKQSPSGYDELGLDIKSKLLLKKNITFSLVNQFVQQQHVPVFHKVRLENFRLNEMNPQLRLLSYARLKTENGTRFFRETELTLSFQQGTEGRNSQKNNSTTLRKERDQVRTAGITLDVLSAISSTWTANTGAEIYLDQVFSKREDIDLTTGSVSGKRGLYPDRSRYSNYSIYTLHHFNHGKWSADAGLRLNWFSIQISDTSLGHVSIHPSAVVGNAALLYALDRKQSVYVSVSSGYRAPNVDDLGTLGIVDFRYELPAADLKPEKSVNSEIGYKFRGKNFSGSAAFFYMDLANLITRVKEEGQVISGYPVYRKENTESAFLRGMEISFSSQPFKQFRLNGGFSYLFGQNLTRHEPLRRVPPMNGKLMPVYRAENWFAAVEWLFAFSQTRLAQGDKEDNRIPVGGTPGWQLLNTYTGYKFKKLSISLGLQNIFNVDYRMHGSGINGVGRSAWLSASFDF